jgi:hypothetical protein
MFFQEAEATPMRIDHPKLERAMIRLGFTQEDTLNLWEELSNAPSTEAQFEPAHVGYFFGALLVIGAMGWFITNGWDRFAGWQLTTIAVAYAAVFVAVGSQVWRKSLFRIPGGLLITMAVCMTPLAVYGIERQFKLWPQLDPGSYTNFHPLINASWVGMETCTVLAAIIGLRYFKFPFLTAPAAYALWYMSMDLTGLIYGKAWSFRQMCIVSVFFGIAMLFISFLLDRGSEVDFSFWGYLFGLLTFTGGLSFMESHNEWSKFGYFLIHVSLVVVSLLLKRKVFVVFGAIGIFGYLSNEAYSHFRNSVAFPFVISLIGIVLIVLAMLYKKNERTLQEMTAAWVPQRTS